MLLKKEEELKIHKILKKSNRYIWKDTLIEKVILIINKIREGQLNRADFFVESILTYEDYCYQLNLSEFLWN